MKLTEECAVIEINKSLKKYLNEGYHVPGATVITRIANFMHPSIRIVQISTNPAQNEVYPVSGGKYAFGRPAIQKFADAGRIELKLPPNPVTIEKGRGIERYTARAIGERYELDGSPKRIEDAKALDLIIREEEMRLKYEEKARKEHSNWDAERRRVFVEQCVRKIMIEKRKFATESAITGAQARVVQKLLGLKPVYTIDELQRPFIIVSVTPVVDMNDPDIKRMVTAHMLGITQELYPNATIANTIPPFPPIQIQASDVEKKEVEIHVPLDDGFNDYPRAVRESIVRQLMKDGTGFANIYDMNDAELHDCYIKLRAV